MAAADVTWEMAKMRRACAIWKIYKICEKMWQNVTKCNNMWHAQIKATPSIPLGGGENFWGVEEGGVGEKMGGGATRGCISPVAWEGWGWVGEGGGGGCSKAISQVWPSDNAINLRSRYSYTASTMFPSGPVQAQSIAFETKNILQRNPLSGF